LVDRSLVVAEEEGEELRYRLLELLREFALEKIAARNEAAPARARHAAYFLSLAKAADAKLEGREERIWLDRLERDDENLRAARDWLEEDPDGADQAVRLAGALERYWAVRERVAEGRRWLERALARPS